MALLSIYAALNLVGAIWVIPDRGGDFLAFYESAVAWGAGQHAYRTPPAEIPNLTPPVLLPFFWLFTRLPFQLALTLWVAGSLACLAATLPILVRRTGMPAWQLGVLVLGVGPAGISLALGQVGFILLLCITRAWNAAQEQQWLRAGLWIGALCVLKPFYGLFGLWLLWRREWRALSAATSVWAISMSAGVWIAGWAEVADWVAALRDVYWQANIYNASVTGMGARLFAPTVITRATLWTPLWVSRPANSAVDVALLAMVVFATVWGVRRHCNDLNRSFVILSVSGLLLSPLGWVHYLPACIGPLLAIRRPSRWIWVAGVLSLFPYQTLLNRAYGPLGTLFVGQWACALAMAIMAVALINQPDSRAAAKIEFLG